MRYTPKVTRPYSTSDVARLRGSVTVEHSLARLGAERLRTLLAHEEWVPALGAMTGGQAVQMVRAGLKAIYLSGWQVAADANLGGGTYPDQSLYPANSGPALARRLNSALDARRPDRPRGGRRRGLLDGADRRGRRGRLRRPAERVRDHEVLHRGRGRGRPLRGSAVLGEEVRPPRRQGAHPDEPVRAHARRRATRSRRARRPDAHHRPDGRALGLAPDERYRRGRPRVPTGERTPEGFFRVQDGIEAAIARGLAYAPYADLIWCETSTPDMDEAEQFAAAIHEQYPDRLLAYNCSPSFNWSKQLSESEIAGFQRDLAAMGYRFQFITLAGFHALNLSMFELAQGYRDEAMTAYVVAPGARVRTRGERLHRDAPPAGGRRGVLRPDHADRLGRGRLDACVARLDRGGAIRHGEERSMSTTQTQSPAAPRADGRCRSRRAARSEPIVTWAERAECTCPEHCDRDHEQD